MFMFFEKRCLFVWFRIQRHCTLFNTLSWLPCLGCGYPACNPNFLRVNGPMIMLECWGPEVL